MLIDDNHNSIVQKTLLCVILAAEAIRMRTEMLGAENKNVDFERKN
jgi:hypothetical protein